MSQSTVLVRRLRVLSLGIVLVLVCTLVVQVVPANGRALAVSPPTSVGLTGSLSVFTTKQTPSFTATTDTTVSGSGVGIAIYDTTTAERLTFCSTGTTCTETHKYSTGGHIPTKLESRPRVGPARS